MNDLNSVFIVGRVKKVKEDEKGKRLIIDLSNHHYSFNEEKKECVEEDLTIKVVLYGIQIEKWKDQLPKGTRIGVNGRIDKDLNIVGYALQILQAVSKAS